MIKEVQEKDEKSFSVKNFIKSKAFLKKLRLKKHLVSFLAVCFTDMWVVVKVSIICPSTVKQTTNLVLV